MAQSFPFSSPFSLPTAFYKQPAEASLTYMNPNVAAQSPGEVGVALGRLQAQYEQRKFQIGGPAYTVTCPGGYVPAENGLCKIAQTNPNPCS